jgi:hypothetical protein
LKKFAVAFATKWMCLNRHPFAIVAFIPGCAAFIAAGWAMGQVQMFLLVLTTVLSVDASLEARMVMLKQAQDNGEA